MNLVLWWLELHRHYRMVRKSSKRPQPDSPRKNQFVGAVQSHRTVAKASRDHGLTPSQAKRIWKKYEETGSIHRRPGSGRKPRLDTKKKQEVVKFVEDHRQMPFDDVGNIIEPHVSGRTIARVCEEHGIHRRVACRHFIFWQVARRRAHSGGGNPLCGGSAGARVTAGRARGRTPRCPGRRRRDPSFRPRRLRCYAAVRIAIHTGRHLGAAAPRAGRGLLTEAFCQTVLPSERRAGEVDLGVFRRHFRRRSEMLTQGNVPCEMTDSMTFSLVARDCRRER